MQDAIDDDDEEDEEKKERIPELRLHAREKERYELVACGQGIMGTHSVKACVVLWRPLEDVSRLAWTICL